jgi:hydrogenase nickel incorporation protein HypA/HybF
MHELSIACSLVDVAQENFPGPGRIVSMSVRVGALSGVVPEALSFVFPVATQGTPAEGAQLELELVPALGLCPECGYQGSLQEIFEACPACAAWPMQVTGGRELQLVQMEVDDDV